MKQLRTNKVQKYHEMTCMRYSPEYSLFLIGACGSLIFVDFRQRIPISTYNLKETNCGIRSVEERHGLVSYWTTESYIGFIDLRMGKEKDQMCELKCEVPNFVKVTIQLFEF